MIGPDGIKMARVDLGKRLAAFRESARLTQERLAEKISYGRSTVASAETGYSEGSRDFWARCDDALAAGGVLLSMYENVKELKATQARLLAVGAHRPIGQAGPVAAVASSGRWREGPLPPIGDTGPENSHDPGDDMRRRQFLPLAVTAAAEATGGTRLAELVSVIITDQAQPAATTQPQSRRVLSHKTQLIKSLYQACDYETVLVGLPPLLRQVKGAEQAADGSEVIEVHELAAAVYHVAASVLLKTGDRPLALLAAQRSTAHADASHNPVTIAAAARIMSHALAGNGYAQQAIALAQRAAHRLEADQGLSSHDAASVYGALILRAAIAAARADDRDSTAALLAEGERAAAYLGHDGNHYWTGFGPTNVLLHRVNAALTLGDAGTAINLARKIDMSRVHLTERRASVYLDVAQAYAQWGRHRQALSVLRIAYSVAPQEVRTRPAAHRLVSDIIAVASGPERSDARQFAASARLPL